MTITGSLDLYKNACSEAREFGKTEFEGTYVYTLQGSNSPVVNRKKAYLEPYYIRIIQAMFFELVTQGNSPLLSHLCSQNGIGAEMHYLKIEAKPMKTGTGGCFDIKPLLDGLNIAFTGKLDRCSDLYFSHYCRDTFQNLVFSKTFDYKKWICNALNDLDRNMELLFKKKISHGEKANEKTTVGKPEIEEPAAKKKEPQTLQDKRPEEKKPEVEEPAEEEKETLLQENTENVMQKEIEPEPGKEETNGSMNNLKEGKGCFRRLNCIAEERRRNDLAAAEQTLELQKNLQEELRQILSLREGIEFSFLQESVSQMIYLYSLAYDILQLHPDTQSKDGYMNLIEDVRELRESIAQCLAMLGVSMIADTGVIYDPFRHTVGAGGAPKRDSVVLNVIREGFEYKNKVLEKAVVEI